MTGLRWTMLGERRAISLLLLAFYTSIFALLAIAQGGAWMACFGALAATYGIAFFALASEWFWARWFAMGLGISGVTMAALGLVSVGWNWGLAIWGAMHGAIYLPLLGRAMADRYENQQAWRQRYNLDEHAVARIKRAVHGTATALPTMILYTLAPRQDQALFGLLLLVGLGAYGLLRMRVWGVLLLGGAAVWGGISALGGAALATACGACSGGLLLPVWGLFGAAALLVAVSPFILPAIRFVRQPPR